MDGGFILVFTLCKKNANVKLMLEMRWILSKLGAIKLSFNAPPTSPQSVWLYAVGRCLANIKSAFSYLLTPSLSVIY